MRLASYVLLLFSISLMFYFMGYQAPLTGLLLNGQNGQPVSAQGVINVIAQNIFNPAFVASVILITIGVGLLTGFSAVYLIPALLLSVILNMVVLPNSSLYTDACMSAANEAGSAICSQAQFSLPITILLNLLLLLTIAEYIRGGG